MNAGLTKNYNAGGTIAARTLVKFGADAKTVVAAAAVSDAIIGVTTDVAVVITEPTDVIHEGIALVKAGGTVTRGGLVTTDASGQGVAAAPAAGTNNRIIGVAMEDAVIGDLFNVLIDLGTTQG
jgi:hypothetical protein